MYSNSHTYTHNVVDGVEAASPVHSINSHKNYHLSASSNKSGSTSTCSTLSLDGSTLQQSISISPIHSPQSGYVVNYSVAGGAALGFNGDNLISTTTNTPPPPPPPPPLPLPTNNNNNSNYNNTIFNENKENKQNTYNRTPLVKNAYNQLLKEYSNKMQTQCNYNGNGYHYNNKNMTPKPFRAQSHLQLQSQSVGNPSNFDNLNNLSNSSQAIVPSPSASVVNTLNSVENNQSIDLQKSATVASSMPYSIGSNVSDEQSNSNNSINVNNNDYDNGSGSGTDRAQDQSFRYVTLTGNVIRSVMPPGKGTNINYKVNQGYARPFGAPASAPKSPVSFPPQPQQQWGASQPAAARPATGNSYATLPRSSIGQSQDPADNLQPQYEEECYESPTAGSAFFRTDPEVEEANRKKSLNFIWPPPNDDTHDTPTAAPLYIPPPETQHIIVKPPAKEQNAPQGQWQSHSAPALSSTMQTEMESGSDSYTSTSTTTTTTTEEYQRMYAAQVKAYQMQQMCEQSGSEFDYYTEDMEDNMRERRSAQICADSLNTPINTYRLVDMVREVTPSPVPQPSQSQKRVIFLDEPEVQEVADSNMYQIEQSSSNDQLEEEDQLILEDRTQILESQRIFQPTPEIKFEIAPVRHIPPTKIPNPVPKEWINPMVSALTTAPEVPFHMQDCPCPKPCDCKSEFEVIAPQKSTIQQEAKPPEAPPQILQESPPTGTRFTKAMTTASEFTMQFAPPVDQEVPLPEPSQPYMPPPTEIKPYLREDYRPKSPFLSALTTAPEKPFEAQFERDVPIHLLDLPTPKAHLSLSDALCVASDREYTPLNPENATHRIEEEQKRKEQKKYEFQVLDHEQELGIEPACTPVEYYTTENSSRRTSHRQSATFAAMQAFQTPNQTVTTNTPRNSVTSLCKEADTDLEYEKYCKAKERNQKRLSFLQKKEVELSQLQNQTQNQNSQTDNTIHKPLVSTNRKESSSSFNASYTVEVNNSNKNNNNNNSYAYASHQLATIATNKFDAHDIIEETAEELEHSEVLFPPPSPLSHLKGKHTSGLHRPETIPKYQRNWTVLPTQSPIRTPEPQELRENIPLAFVDAPKSNNAKVSSDNHVHKPIAQHQQQQQQQPQLAQPQQPRKSLTINSATSAPSASNAVAMTQRGSVEQTSSRLSSTPTVPIIIEERCGPISMAFQSLDELVPKDESQTPSRCFTPCSFTNKPAPIVPFYQTAEKLCFDECPAQHARDYDRRSASPFPDRARSPAPGPPPNPLAAIRAPRVKENELSPRMLQAGSITTGQSYLGAQQQHYESTTQAGYQSFLQKPETVQTSQVGDTRVEQRQSESQLAEQQKSQTQSKTTTQIGNTQIERRRRVTEEFEHSQTAKTIEIRTETDRRQSYGKTGFVANVARRLSGMEQEINSLSSQSQSISERAAHLSSGTVFPQLKSPEPPEKFPTKPVLPPHDEPQPQSYILSATANNNNKMIGPPPGFQQQQQRNSLSACYGTSLATAIRQQQQQQQQQQKSLSAYESTTSSIQSSLSNAVSSSLTMASASTTNQASVSSGVCPVTGTFCRPGHTCCKQQVMQTARADARSMSVSSAISNQYRPTASTGAVGFKPPQPQPQPQQQPQSQAFAAAPPQAPNVVARASIDIDPTNDVGSAGGAGGKGGAFGATSAPKRGRGIMNKAVAPGVRVPLCNSCQTQIRGPFITALGRIWCPEHFICVNANCRRPLQDIGFVEEKGDLYCEYCFEKYLAPSCSKCNSKIKGDCLNAIGRHFHPECFTCAHCGKIFGNTPFFLEDGNPYCEADWNELFTTKCFACGFPVEAGDRWVEALNHNYHSQCFNCTYCKQNLEGQSFYNKGGRPFCKNHAR